MTANKHHFVCIIAAALAVVSSARATPQLEAKYNVLMIVVDDLNDWVATHGGHAQSLTPNLDRLARRGMKFMNAHCTAPICNPSRSSFNTGKYPFNIGIYDNEIKDKKLFSERPSISRHFLNNNYYTVGSGKIRHVFAFTQENWDVNYKSKISGAPSAKEDIALGLKRFKWGPCDQPDEEFGDHLNVDFINSQYANIPEGKPFFFACGIYRPHTPLYVPRRFFDQYPLEDVQLPVVEPHPMDGLSIPAKAFAWNFYDWLDPTPTYERSDFNIIVDKHQQWDTVTQAYLACVAWTDYQVGRLLDQLDASPYTDNTIIVLFSDHGWHLGEKQSFRKATLWEESTRVPFIVSVPGFVTAGAETKEPASLIDLFPTLIDLCGLPSIDDLDGTSMRPVLENPLSTVDRPAITTMGRGNHAVRSRDYRYIQYYEGSEEFYDHTQDPKEWTNLINNPEYSEIIAQHRKFVPADK
ncbi:sulfatase [Pontiella sulfatireligans]|uniref:Arylsulfatase n=1 Tax=Pontiella sulfatireligans TaxID=2750658 RepID=A0A6C2UEA8_9BACT|nr:sulfatase [Pontiella sulfatireligans]SPS74187.1 sulfatase S1_7 [Kiritimatiellales bacterium]VGO18552.1 Arylsulfatase [Pontiella sulfatireligans]